MRSVEWIDGELFYPPLSDPAWWRILPRFDWIGSVEVLPMDFHCGFCGNKVSSSRGMAGVNSGLRSTTPVPAEHVKAGAYICPHCSRVSYWEESEGMSPKPLYGYEVGNLPEPIATVYNEARRTLQAGAFTGVMGLCRSLLAHISKEQGSPKSTFNEAIGYLETEGHITKQMKPTLDWIRQKGNEAAHDLVVFCEADALLVMDFTANLLRNVYDYPRRIP